jgi:hypothetical protein
MMDVRLSQSGLDVTGTMRLSQGGLSDVGAGVTATLDATVLPTTAHLTATYDYGLGCHGSFSGALSVTADAMDGAFTGSNCVHTFSGRLRLTRLAPTP